MRKLLWICLLLIASIAAKSQEQSEFTVLQWNIWQEGTKVTGGYDAIVDEIIRLKPDFVTFSEVRNYNSRPLKSAHLRNIVRKQYPADFFNKPQKSPHGSFEVVCGGS